MISVLDDLYDMNDFHLLNNPNTISSYPIINVEMYTGIIDLFLDLIRCGLTHNYKRKIFILFPDAILICIRSLIFTKVFVLDDFYNMNDFEWWENISS